MIVKQYKNICQVDQSLRDYQQEAKQAIFEAWDRVSSVMFQMPTGTGKTRLFTSIINDINNYSITTKQPVKIIVIAHRTELIDQIDEHLSRYSIPHGIIAGGTERNLKMPVQVASIQTLTNKRNDFNKIAGYDFNNYWEYGKLKAIQLYYEHQEELSDSIENTFGSALLLDCHSFSEQDNVLCPHAHVYKDIDICIGFNEDDTKPSEEFIDSVKKYFTSCGYRVECNVPFSNSKTVNAAHPYQSLMIEVNKHCYMNEETLEITDGYYKLHRELQELYAALVKG